jgi:hypothetical protein
MQVELQSAMYVVMSEHLGSLAHAEKIKLPDY